MHLRLSGFRQTCVAAARGSRQAPTTGGELSFGCRNKKGPPVAGWALNSHSEQNDQSIEKLCSETGKVGKNSMSYGPLTGVPRPSRAPKIT